MLRTINAENLTRYKCDEPTRLVFKNREWLAVPPGLYFVSAPGIVVDLEAMTCIKSPRRKKENG
jgi:hypothetical protein